MARSDEYTSGFRAIHGEVDELFGDLMGGRRGTAVSRALTDVYVTEDPAAVNVTMDIAGLDPHSLEVVLDGELLVIRGGRRRPVEAGRRVYHHVEIDWGPFERRLRIAAPVDPSGATVTYERGLLHIALPLASQRVTARVLIGFRIPG